MEFNNPYYNKIIDLFYIRFGEIEDKNNTTCYMGCLTADSKHVYHWNLLISNANVLQEILDRYIINKNNIRVYTLQGTLIRKFASRKCVLKDVNVIEDITNKFFNNYDKFIEFNNGWVNNNEL